MYARFSGALLLLFVCGCVTMERLPYDPATERFVDDRILGTWRSDEGDVTITRVDGRSYLASHHADVVEQQRPKVSAFDLVRIGKHTYAFGRAEQGASSSGYNFGRVAIKSDSISVAMPSVARWGELLEREHVVHRKTKGEGRSASLISVYISDAPKRVQQFMFKYQDDAALWQRPVVLKRLR
jgi:hypothetical protein